jgi:hypothetical protein
VKQLGPLVGEESAEQVEDPVELAREPHTAAEHRDTEQDRAEDSPEQHAVLELWHHAELRERQRDDEDVVDGQGLFKQVCRQIRDGGFHAVGVTDRRVFELRTEPVVLVNEVDDDRERQAEDHPADRPHRGALQRLLLVLAMQNPEVEEQQERDQSKEPNPEPDHPRDRNHDACRGDPQVRSGAERARFTTPTASRGASSRRRAGA